jgi:hypothetical protein
MVIPDKSEGIWVMDGMLTGSSWQVNSALQTFFVGLAGG